MLSLLQQTINKYGGTDEVYRQKLKSTIAGAMGYSNYVNKANAAAGRPLSLNLKGNITPEGVQSLVRGAIGMRETETEAYDNLADRVESEAETLASKLASKNKASDKYRYDTSFVFQPTNPVESEILKYAQNPNNEDGSTKSLQQFEAELNEKFGQTEGYSSEDINKMIVDKLPSDYIGKERQYKYRFSGMSEEQANDEMIIDYGNMIVMGRGKEVPPEFYPAAYATLTPAEKAAVQGLVKSERDKLLEGLIE